MIMTILLLIFSALLNIVLLYVCYNLYRKNISYEEIIISINNSVHRAIHNMRLVDSNGVFEADDEVGDTFKGLLQITKELEGIINVEEQKE